MIFFDIPSLPECYVRRREYEDALNEALQQGVDNSVCAAPLIITNPSDSTATGKTLLLLSVLQSLLKAGRLNRVLWLSFGQYPSAIPPYRTMLVTLARTLRSIFSSSLGTSSTLLQLHGASVEECQEYIRLLVTAVRAANKQDVDSIVLVLDEVTRARHASLFAHLGLRTVLTARNMEVVQHLVHEGEPEGKQVLEVGRITALQAESLAMRMSNVPRSLSGSKAFRALQQLTGSLRCFSMLSYAFINDDQHNDRLMQDLQIQGTSSPPVRQCMQAMLSSMPAVERTALEKVLLLPHHGAVTTALAAILWKQSHKMANTRITVFAKMGVVLLSGDKRSFHVPYDLVKAISDLAFCDSGPYAADLRIDTRIEAAHAALLYVTDIELLTAPSFQDEYLTSFVTCWEHLLQLDANLAFGEHVERPSPIRVYERLLNAEQTGLANTLAAARALEVVLSINPDCFSACHGDESWAAVRNWAIDELYPFVDTEHSVKEAQLPHSVYMGFARCLVNDDPEKAAACVETFLQVFCATTEDSSTRDESTPLLCISDAFLMLTRCHRSSGSLAEAQKTLLSATESWQEAFRLIFPTAGKNNPSMERHPDAVSLKLLDVSLKNMDGKHKEAHFTLHEAIANCEDTGTADLMAHELLSIYCFCLGETLSAQGFRNKARKAFEECLAMRLEMYGDLHPVTNDAMERLASCCLSSNLFDKSSTLLRRAMSTRCILYGLDHPSLRDTFVALCACMDNEIAQGAPSETVVYFLRPILKEFAAAEKNVSRYSSSQGYFCRGDQRDGYVQALHLMAEISLSLNDERQAKAFSKKAVEVVSSTDNLDVVPCYKYGISAHTHRQLGQAYEHLGSVCQRRRRYHKAVENFQQALVHFINGCSGSKVTDPLMEQLLFSLRAEGYHADADAFTYIMSRTHTDGGLPSATDFANTATAPAFEKVMQAFEDIGEYDMASRVQNVLSETLSTSAEVEETKRENATSVDVEPPLQSHSVPEVTLEKETAIVTPTPTSSVNKEVAEKEVGLALPVDSGEEVALSSDAGNSNINESVVSISCEEKKQEVASLHEGETELEAGPDAELEEDFKITVETEDIVVIQVDRSSEIIAACLSKDKSCVLVLLEAGVDVDTRCEEDGSTLLLIACMNQHVDMVEALLQKGADANLHDNDGNSALLLTCFLGNYDLYSVLVGAVGFSPVMLTHSDADGKSPLLVAAENGHAFIVADILKRNVVDINTADMLGNTALIFAAMNSHEDVVALLCETEGVHISASNVHGDSSLLLAALRGNVSIVRLLLYAGADKRAANVDGTTPMDVAVWNNEEDMFALLIEDDSKAARIQSVWRMYRVRSSIGDKVDEHIANSLKARWAQRHFNILVKIQCRVRIFNAKRRYKRRQLDSISESAHQYATMKLIGLMQVVFHRYVKSFRARKARGSNSIIGVKLVNSTSSAAAAGSGRPMEDVEVDELVYLNEAPLLSSVVSTDTPSKTSTKGSTAAGFIMSPKMKKFANAFSVAAQPPIVTVNGDVKQRSGLSTVAIRPSLFNLLQRGATWEEIEHALELSPLEVQASAGSGEYPLQQAIRTRARSDVISGLLKSFPQATVTPNHMGNTALHLLLSNLANFDQAQELFLSILAANEDSTRIANKSGELPLHLAARFVSMNATNKPQLAEVIIRELIKTHPKALQTVDSRGNLPLHVCLQKHVSPEILSMLLGPNPDGVHVVAADGRYPLRLALQNGCSLDVVRKILAVSGGKVSYLDGAGSALHIAIKYKVSEDILLDIITRDPTSLKRVDNSGCSALHLALKNYAATPSITAEVIRRLLDHGEEAVGIKHLGMYPLQIALEKKLEIEIIEALAEAHPFSDEFKTKAEMLIEQVIQSKRDGAVDRSYKDSKPVTLPASKSLPPNSFEIGKVSREARAEQAEKEREERRAKAAQERAGREAEAVRRRQQIAKDHALRVAASKTERAKYLQSGHDTFIEGQRVAIVLESSTEAKPVKQQHTGVAESPQISDGKSLISKWKKVVTAPVVGHDDTNIKRKEEAGQSTSIQMWKNSNTAITPTKFNRAALYGSASVSPARSAGGAKKVEISPMGSARALSHLLRYESESENED